MLSVEDKIDCSIAKHIWFLAACLLLEPIQKLAREIKGLLTDLLRVTVCKLVVSLLIVYLENKDFANFLSDLRVNYSITLEGITLW